MTVETELKARVWDPDHVRGLLAERAVEQRQIYRDRYFDWPSASLDAQGYEVRLRTVDSGTSSQTVLTFKEPPVHTSGSKPEHETGLDQGEPIAALVTALGLVERIAFSKHCRKYRFFEQERELLATLVHVQELDGTFLEVETLVTDEQEVSAGLEVVRSVLAGIGAVEDDLTTETYTAAVAAQRGTDGLTR